MNKDILKLAIPNILSNISIPLLSTVDVALMGNLSLIHLGAIGIATMIFNFFFWNFGFLRMGTTGMVAQAYGAKNNLLISQIFSQGIYLALLISMVIVVLQVPIGYIAHLALGVSVEHEPLVWQYFNIRIWCAPASLVTYSLLGWLFGMQNAVIPMIVTIFINVLNIITSYYLVVFLKWDIAGAAFGTLFAEYCGLIILVLIIYVKYKITLIKPRLLSNWIKFLDVNKDLFIRTIILTSAFAIFYRQSAVSGELVLATNIIMLQFLSWTSYGIDGFSFATESLVGRYKGALKKRLLLKVISYSFRWAFGLSLMLSLFFGIYGINLAAIFTDNPEVLSMIASHRIWLVLLPVLAFSCYIWDGIYIGLTKTAIMRDSMILSILGYILAIWILDKYFINAIWMAFAAFMTFRGLLLTAYWLKTRRTVLRD